MKFIKDYKLFEGIRQVSIRDDMETVKEICYDLTDEGNWNIEYNTAGNTVDPSLYGIPKPPGTRIGYICMYRSQKKNYSDVVTFKFDDIKETVTRLVNYFGIANLTTSDTDDRYLGSSFQPNQYLSKVGYNGFIDVNGENLRKYDDIKYFIIWFIMPYCP